MKVLWNRGGLAARDVYAALPEGHGWAIKTVKTLLSRLVAKGVVEYEPVANAYLYRPAVTREQVTREEIRGFVDRVMGGAVMPMLAHFIEAHDLTDEEVAELEGMLRRRRQAGQGGRRKGGGR